MPTAQLVDRVAEWTVRPALTSSNPRADSFESFSTVHGFDELLYLNAHNHDVAYALFERAEDAVEVTANLALADPLLRRRSGSSPSSAS